MSDIKYMQVIESLGQKSFLGLIISIPQIFQKVVQLKCSKTYQFQTNLLYWHNLLPQWYSYEKNCGSQILK